MFLVGVLGAPTGFAAGEAASSLPPLGGAYFDLNCNFEIPLAIEIGKVMKELPCIQLGEFVEASRGRERRTVVHDLGSSTLMEQALAQARALCSQYHADNQIQAQRGNVLCDVGEAKITTAVLSQVVHDEPSALFPRRVRADTALKCARLEVPILARISDRNEYRAQACQNIRRAITNAQRQTSDADDSSSPVWLRALNQGLNPEQAISHCSQMLKRLNCD